MGELAQRLLAETGPWRSDEPPRPIRVPERMAAVIPASNGIGNARALALIGSLLANGGEVAGRRYLGREIVEQAAQEQSYAEDQLMGWCRYGLGFGLHSDE